MTAYRYPGLFGDPRSGRIWPLFVVSAVLHVGLFWGFSRFHIRPGRTPAGTPIQMVELGGGLGGPRGGGGKGGSSSRPAKAPERAKPEPAAVPVTPKPKATEALAKPVPAAKPPAPAEPKAKPEPKVATAAAKPEPVPKAPPVTQKPEPDAKPLPRTPTLPAKAPLSPVPKEPPRSKPEEGGEDRVAQSIARLKERQGGQDEDRVADRIARLKEKRGSSDAQVADKVARLRERLIQGSEQQVSQHVAALREKFGTKEPGHGGGSTGTGSEGPVGVSGGGGPGLQGFLESRYVQGVRDHLNLYWSVPETLKGKGYEAFVSVIVDRRGKIVNWSVRRSGNRLFDEKVERAVAEADPLPAVPSGMTGDRFEFELRFSAP